MPSHAGLHHASLAKSRRHVWLARVAGAVLLWACTAGAHAASVYQCVDTHGRLTYRDTPCAAHARQTKLDLAGQPLIDPGAPPQPQSVQAPKSRGAHARSRNASVAARTRKAKSPTSWECRAADGEVFYRHTRCPGSVPGDGVVRSRYAEKMSSGRTRGRHDAWSRVPVHGEKVSRAEACRRIRSPSAAGRDGHQRDETVDTYVRLTGHDPCSGA